MDKKKKTILASLIGLIIVFLLALLIYANFIYEEKDRAYGIDPDTVSPSNPVGGDNSNHAPSDFEDDTNSDASDENITINENNERMNISPKLLEEHKYENITITSMSITSVTGTDYAKVGLNIRNDGEYISSFTMLVTFYKKDGSKLSEVYISCPSITPNEVIYEEEEIFQRVIDAYDYSFTYFFIEDEGGGGL